MAVSKYQWFFNGTPVTKKWVDMNYGGVIIQQGENIMRANAVRGSNYSFSNGLVIVRIR